MTSDLGFFKIILAAQWNMCILSVVDVSSFLKKNFRNMSQDVCCNVLLGTVLNSII